MKKIKTETNSFHDHKVLNFYFICYGSIISRTHSNWAKLSQYGLHVNLQTILNGFLKKSKGLYGSHISSRSKIELICGELELETIQPRIAWIEHACQGLKRGEDGIFSWIIRHLLKGMCNLPLCFFIISIECSCSAESYWMKFLIQANFA